MKTPFNLLVFCLTLLSVTHLTAQFSDVKFEHLSLEHGLSQSNLTAIIQDQTGFMWFGTLDGLNKYDGYEFTIYKHSSDDSTSLSSSSIWSLYEDRFGYIWVSTIASGLNRFDPRTGRFRRFQHDPDDPRSISDDRVRAIAEDASGQLWIGTRDAGLNRFDREKGEFVHLRNNPNDPASLSDNHVRTMLADRDGNFWIGTLAGGLNRMVTDSSGAIEFMHYRHDPDDSRSLSHDHVESLFQDERGAIWIGTYGGGLNKLVGGTNGETEFVHYRADGRPGSLSHDVVETIVEDHVRTLWVGTNAGGLNRFDRETQRFTSYKNQASDISSLSHNNVETLFEDRTGNLWIGTWGGGIDKLDRKPRKFQHYRHTPGEENSLCHGDVRAISEGPDGALWIGTAGGGLDRIDGASGTITHYRHDESDPTSLSSNNVRALCLSRSGVLWIGTYGGGLNKLDWSRNESVKFVHYGEVAGLNRNIWAVYEDTHGKIWIGTNAGLSRLEPETNVFTHYRHDPEDEMSLSHPIVRTIYEDLARQLWVGTYGGLNLFDPASETFARYMHAPGNRNSLSHNGVMAIYQDHPDVLWLGTLGGGLNRFDLKKQKFQHYTESDGLPNDFVHAIVSDASGSLWMSTNRGLTHFDTQAQHFRNYDVTDGLQSNEFNVGAVYRSADGKLFFGGVNGITAFQPDRIPDNPHLPPVVLTGFRVFNRPVEFERSLTYLEKIELSYRQRFFSFEFAALDYTNPSKNRYAYKLEGFDSEWIECGDRRFASYTNLDPGEYRFRVKASNNDGLWNEQGTAITIRIEPPFWQTWWFQILAAMTAVGIVGFAYHRRVSNLRRQNTAREQFASRLIEVQEAERKRIASELHDSLGQELLILNNSIQLLKNDGQALNRLREALDRLSEITVQSIDQVREISANLHPHQVERLGLKKAVEAMLDKLSKSTQIAFHPEIADVPDLDKDQQINVYRIFQEGVNNIVKHAEATEVRIRLERIGEALRIQIADDGRGFDMSARAESRGFGLMNMTERVKLRKGKISIQSRPGEGTTIDILLPVRQQKRGHGNEHSHR